MSSINDIIGESRPTDFFNFTKSYTDGVGREFRETVVDDYYSSSSGEIAKIVFDEGTRIPNRFSIIKPEVDKYGAVRVSDSQKKHYPVSRLVYSAWGDQPLDTSCCIAHLDLDSRNNSIDNLLQLTKDDNIKFQRDNGVYAKNSTKSIKVRNNTTGEITPYNSVKEFLIDIQAPDYIVRRTDISSLKKLSKFKHLDVLKEEA